MHQDSADVKHVFKNLFKGYKRDLNKSSTYISQHPKHLDCTFCPEEETKCGHFLV